MVMLFVIYTAKRSASDYMTKQELIDYCLTFTAAYEDYPFDDTTTLIRHSTNKKMFALIDHLHGRLHVTMKCEPLVF